MSSAPARVGELRDLLRRIEGPRRELLCRPTGLAEFDAWLPGGGLPCGRITEIFQSSGAWRLCAVLLAEATRRGYAALIESDSSLQFYVPAAIPLGLRVENLLVIRPQKKKQSWWAIEEVARSPGLELVVAACESAAQKVLRRWQLACEESGTALVLIRPAVSRREPGLGSSLALSASLLGDPLRSDLDPSRAALGVRQRRLRLELLRHYSRRSALEWEIDDAKGLMSPLSSASK